MVNFESLVTQGFIVISNFLTDSELLSVKKHYNKVKEELSKNPSLKTDYNIVVVEPNRDIQFLLDKIKTCVDQINTLTDITANTVDTELGYIDNSLFGCQGWHQDHGPYFKWGNLYNSLNFWLAINKLDSNNNGLSLIPYDKIPEKIKSKFIGKGAKRFEILQKRTRVFNDADQSIFVLPFDIEDYAISPTISEKDLIIMRGDLIHKSQNLTENRLALSIRCYKKC